MYYARPKEIGHLEVPKNRIGNELRDISNNGVFGYFLELWGYTRGINFVLAFSKNMKNSIMHAHGQIIEAPVKQTMDANKHRPASSETGYLVYLSTRYLKLPKNRVKKLIPKYIGLFSITKTIEPRASYKLELSDDLKTAVVILFSILHI